MATEYTFYIMIGFASALLSVGFSVWLGDSIIHGRWPFRDKKVL
jgi:hypothetical protein